MSLWPWLGLAGLGAFHGINPAMGWLFAVALTALAVVGLGRVVDERAVGIASGVILIGWAAYHALYGSRHRVRVGMRTGMAGLALWSFLMAGAHGAGLMLVPILIPLAQGGSHVGHVPATGSLWLTLAAVGVHTLAMLATTGAIAVVVYEWLGLAFLRRGWINLDLVWTAALVATGAILLVAWG